MCWADLGWPCLLVLDFTNQRFKEGVRMAYWLTNEHCANPFQCQRRPPTLYRRVAQVAVSRLGGPTPNREATKGLHDWGHTIAAGHHHCRGIKILPTR